MEKRKLDDILDELTHVTDAIGRGERGLEEYQERLIQEMNEVARQEEVNG